MWNWLPKEWICEDFHLWFFSFLGGLSLSVKSLNTSPNCFFFFSLVSHLKMPIGVRFLVYTIMSVNFPIHFITRRARRFPYAFKFRPVSRMGMDGQPKAKWKIVKHLLMLFSMMVGIFLTLSGIDPSSLMLPADFDLESSQVLLLIVHFKSSLSACAGAVRLWGSRPCYDQYSYMGIGGICFKGKKQSFRALTSCCCYILRCSCLPFLVCFLLECTMHALKKFVLLF